MQNFPLTAGCYNTFGSAVFAPITQAGTGIINRIPVNTNGYPTSCVKAESTSDSIFTTGLNRHCPDNPQNMLFNMPMSMLKSPIFSSKQNNQNALFMSREEALVTLTERTSYPIMQENGQRRYGPPPDWIGPQPPRGCEVFIGKIPRDCFEDELVPVFETVGKIYMFRLMMDFSGCNRGYGFCVYTNREDTRRAVLELDSYEIRKGKLLGVCFSVDNCRLFVGGIPKDKNKDEIMCEMLKVTEGVKDVIVYPSIADKTKNRGFAFVEYENHKAAAMARRKLIPGRIHLWGHQIAVDWAEPEREVDEDVMSKVRILYVRNLMLHTTEEALRNHFNRAIGALDAVERVKKIRDYAFVHFHDRIQASSALRQLDGTILDGSRIEVTWAKPVDKAEAMRRGAISTTNLNISNYSSLCFTPDTQPTLGTPVTVNMLGIPVAPRSVQVPLTGVVGTPSQVTKNNGILGANLEQQLKSLNLNNHLLQRGIVPSSSPGSIQHTEKRMTASAFSLYTPKMRSSIQSLYQMRDSTRVVAPSHMNVIPNDIRGLGEQVEVCHSSLDRSSDKFVVPVEAQLLKSTPEVDRDAYGQIPVRTEYRAIHSSLNELTSLCVSLGHGVPKLTLHSCATSQMNNRAQTYVAQIYVPGPHRYFYTLAPVQSLEESLKKLVRAVSQWILTQRLTSTVPLKSMPQDPIGRCSTGTSSNLIHGALSEKFPNEELNSLRQMAPTVENDSLEHRSETLVHGVAGVQHLFRLETPPSNTTHPLTKPHSVREEETTIEQPLMLPLSEKPSESLCCADSTPSIRMIDNEIQPNNKNVAQHVKTAQSYMDQLSYAMLTVQDAAQNNRHYSPDSKQMVQTLSSGSTKDSRHDTHWCDLFSKSSNVFSYQKECESQFRIPSPKQSVSMEYATTSAGNILIDKPQNFIQGYNHDANQHATSTHTGLHPTNTM